MAAGESITFCKTAGVGAGGLSMLLSLSIGFGTLAGAGMLLSIVSTASGSLEGEGVEE